VKEHVQPAAGKILVAYFSHSGNTRVIAEEIQKTVGGDLFRIEGVSPYPKDYNAVVEQAKQELSANVRPELTAKVDNMAAYQTIVIGYPIWWATMPMPVLTFLGSYDFSGRQRAWPERRRHRAALPEFNGKSRPGSSRVGREIRPGRGRAVAAQNSDSIENDNCRRY
jgi:flavodoxin